MTYHKIRGVDKTTCTAEQKIAYNLAWRIWMDSRYGLDDPDVKNWAAVRLEETVGDAIAYYIDLWQTDPAAKKYNVDAVFSALRAGLKSYILGKYHILTSYTDIGQMFPAHYWEG